MRITQEGPTFQPITITLETYEDLYNLYHYFNCSEVRDNNNPLEEKLTEFGWSFYDKLKPFYTSC